MPILTIYRPAFQSSNTNEMPCYGQYFLIIITASKLTRRVAHRC